MLWRLRGKLINNFDTFPLGLDNEGVKTEPGSQTKESGSEGGDQHADSGHGGGFEVFHVDFGRVSVPFIIGVWILSASIAKIGMYISTIFPVFANTAVSNLRIEELSLRTV